MDRSRIPQFYKMTVAERVQAIRDRGVLSADDYRALTSGDHTLTVHNADKMIENVIGVMGLPIGLGLNFLINGKNHVVPMVVEEPSIVAALSSAAKLVRSSGGFETESTESLLIGQIQVVDMPNIAKAKAALLDRKQEVLNLANSMHPNMVARGGGARDVEAVIHALPEDKGDMLVAHLLVDTCDAMGANLVNTMCEGVATLIETITNGKVFLRILSNLTDRSMVKARARIPVDALAGKGFSGEEVRDAIILASDFAAVDPYRAATHNKGIMNGIDAVALAMGNDWRAIEAGAHAYAGRGSSYTSLSRWFRNEHGDLEGVIEVPIKAGTVGGPLQSNPSVALNHRILDVESARELAEIMGAAGLAQNFSALRALATEGIQQGHMTLHARSVATAAGAGNDVFDTVVENLIESGDIKIWKAQQIISELEAGELITPGEAAAANSEHPRSAGHGKIILLGEHAVVYGAHAVAAPIPMAIEASVHEADDGVTLIIPRWGLEQRMNVTQPSPKSFEKSLAIVLDQLGLKHEPMRIEIFPKVPKAMGLGGSAALAVAITRAIDEHFKLKLGDERINELAFECEKVAHGHPSGIDNTLATYGRFLVYKKGDPPEINTVDVPQPIRIVIGMSHTESLTAHMVARVRQAWEGNKALYERIFNEIDTLSLLGLDAIKHDDLVTLGEMMNVCQGLLNALGVSSWEIEELVQIARNNGALGAKVTGGGGGGSMIALCPDTATEVVAAMQSAGYRAMEVEIG